MYDDHGRLVDKAGPSNAVQIFVLSFCICLPMFAFNFLYIYAILF
jgi:hypothetical protein